MDKRPPYFKFKTAYKTRLNDTNKWLTEKILNNKKNGVILLALMLIFTRKVKKVQTDNGLFLSNNKKMSNWSKLTSWQTG